MTNYIGCYSGRKLRTIKTARFCSRVFFDVNLSDSHQKIAERQNIYILEVRCFLPPPPFGGAKKIAYYKNGTFL
jgi:hypothetical protein